MKNTLITIGGFVIGLVIMTNLLYWFASNNLTKDEDFLELVITNDSSQVEHLYVTIKAEFEELGYWPCPDGAVYYDNGGVVGSGSYENHRVRKMIYSSEWVKKYNAMHYTIRLCIEPVQKSENQKLDRHSDL